MVSKIAWKSALLVAALALATPVFAKPINRKFTLPSSAKVGVANLQAGQYKFRIDGERATIRKSGDVVAEVNGHWETLPKAWPFDAIVQTSEGKLKGLRFAGKKEIFVLDE